MKTIRKALALVLALCIVLSLAACTTGSKDPDLLRVGEVGLAVVHGLIEPVQVFFLPGVPVEHGGGDEEDGLPTMPSTKGSTFKGPFHVPRSLILVDGILGELLEK